MKWPFAADAEQTKEFIKRMHAACLPMVQNFTVPFYAEQHGHMKQCGSGVLLRIANRFFVLTAAHVIDIHFRHSLPMFVSNRASGEALLRFDSAQVRSSKMPQSEDRKDDQFDICVAELPQELADKFSQCNQFLYLRDVDPSDRQVPGSWYLVLGYPSQANPGDAIARKVTSNASAYGSIIYMGSRGNLDNFDPEVEIAIDFTLIKSTDDDGKPVVPPPPGGMSGCGIWRLAEAASSIHLWKPEDMKLVGIEHTWNKEIEVLRGTQVKYALQIIYRNYPDLQSVMRMNHLPLPMKF